MATREEVERRLDALVARVNGAPADVRASLGESLRGPRVVEVTVADLDAVYWTTLSGGTMEPIRAGSPASADIRVRATSDALVEVLDGHRSLFSSFLGGQVKVDAPFADLMRLRKLA